jgi:hypothetical protein
MELHTRKRTRRQPRQAHVKFPKSEGRTGGSCPDRHPRDLKDPKPITEGQSKLDEGSRPQDGSRKEEEKKGRTVVLSTGSDALLRVDRSLELAERRVGIGRSEEDRLILVHTGIDKEERG